MYMVVQRVLKGSVLAHRPTSQMKQHFHGLPLNFFAALPNSGSGHSSGLNLDLPNVGTPPHQPQPAEPLAALSGRAPNIAYEKV